MASGGGHPILHGGEKPTTGQLQVQNAASFERPHVQQVVE
jgi:hypothetical protein